MEMILDWIMSISPLRQAGLVTIVLFATVIVLNHKGKYISSKGKFTANLLFLFLLAVLIATPSALQTIGNLAGLSGGNRDRILFLFGLINFYAIFKIVSTDGELGRLKHYFQRATAQNILLQNKTQLKKSKCNHSIFIVPVYNEAANIPHLLAKCENTQKKLSFDLLFIDDGSEDDTASILEAHPHVLYIKLPTNHGQGFASAIGYHVAKELGYKFIGTMDGDNQHDPEEIPQLYRTLIDAEADLVIGSRFLHSQPMNMPFPRRVLANFISFILSYKFSTKITDPSSGFKLMTAKTSKLLNTQEFQYQSLDILISALKAKLKVIECHTESKPREHGLSIKGNTFIYGMNFLSVLIRKIIR